MLRPIQDFFDPHLEDDIGVRADPGAARGDIAQQRVECGSGLALMDRIDSHKAWRSWIWSNVLPIGHTEILMPSVLRNIRRAAHAKFGEIGRSKNNVLNRKTGLLECIRHWGVAARG